VVQALRNAIRLNRVTHAYLFSGTRGVGKTSLARIFAKCLNCVEGPTEAPCNKCDICLAISAGQDVDVIEIDGASNNGVEAVRDLRQNAGLRPSRSRFKIYYIDEVHMLSTGAFNALLKTLEEPPAHVKFLFATTEPGKIPVTVLSRCQRYDFAGMMPGTIAESLSGICEREGIAADPDALNLVARRANGSMRDAQSLLEPLLALGPRNLTVEDVRKALGLASDDGLVEMLEAMVERDACRALLSLDATIQSGVQPGEVLAGLSELMRDVMVASAGAPMSLLEVSPSHRGRVQAIAERWSIDTALAALEILSQARLRLRGSSQPRLVVELALARIARLESFEQLETLIEHVGQLSRIGSSESGGATPPEVVSRWVPSRVAPPARGATPERADQRVVSRSQTAIRRNETAPLTDETTSARSQGSHRISSEAHAAHGAMPSANSVTTEDFAAPAVKKERLDWNAEALAAAWSQIVELLADKPQRSRWRNFYPHALESPGTLVLKGPGFQLEMVQKPENRLPLEQVLTERLGRPIVIRVEAAPEFTQSNTTEASQRESEAIAMRDPLVQCVLDLFEGQLVRVEPSESAGIGIVGDQETDPEQVEELDT
jgi:DNA polymerase-3 subunit gamma/tau